MNRHRCKSRHAAVALTIAMLVHAGCRAGSSAASHAATHEQGPAPSADEPVAVDCGDFRAAVDAAWEARRAADWPALFSFLDPDVRGNATPAEFAAWAAESEPFIVQSYLVDAVETCDGIGWALVTARTTLRRFPGDPVDSQRVEKWRCRRGCWTLVPPEQAATLPAPPSQRDRVAEARLAARFLGAWNARRIHDASALREYLDPEDEVATASELIASQDRRLEHLKCDVLWAEVLGGVGRVRARLLVRAADPEIHSGLPDTAEITERWVLRGDEWYCDVAPRPTRAEKHGGPEAAARP